MKQEELNNILEQHKTWLETNGANGHRAYLCGANLKGLYLQRSFLRNAKFQNTNFQDANLEGACLQGASLIRANFKGANLQRVFFQNSDLQYANFQNANLQGAYLQGTDLQFTSIKAFQICNYFAYSHEGRLNINCLDMSLEEWAVTYERIGTKHGYSKEEIRKMGYLIDSLIKGYL